MALLEVNGITKVFGGLKAVSEVSFEVEEGEIVSIIGPNGAGKTTVYNMLTGVYKVDGGTVVFEGKEIQNHQPRQIVQAGIARTFQNIRLFPNMRVIENVLIGEHVNIHYNFWNLLFKTPKYRREEKAAAERAIALLESLGPVSYTHLGGHDRPGRVYGASAGRGGEQEGHLPPSVSYGAVSADHRGTAAAEKEAGAGNGNAADRVPDGGRTCRGS